MDKKNFILIPLAVLITAVVIAGIAYYIGTRNCTVNGTLHLEVAKGLDPSLKPGYGNGMSKLAPGKMNEIVTPEDADCLVNGKGPEFKGKSVVRIYGEGCGHCTNTKPAFESAAKSSPVKFYTMNISKHRGKLDKYKITGVPHIMMLKDGAEVAKYSGDRSAPSFVAFANRQEMPAQPYQ